MRRRCPEVERRKVWMPASCRRASAQHAGQPGYRVEAAGVLDVEAALAAVFRRRPQRALERVADAAVAAERVGDGDARDGGGRVFQGHNVSRFRPDGDPGRSEEHTSELQSLMRISYAVFCLKKKKTTATHINHTK